MVWEISILSAVKGKCADSASAHCISVEKHPYFPHILSCFSHDDFSRASKARLPLYYPAKMMLCVFPFNEVDLHWATRSSQQNYLSVVWRPVWKDWRRVKRRIMTLAPVPADVNSQCVSQNKLCSINRLPLHISNVALTNWQQTTTGSTKNKYNYENQKNNLENPTFIKVTKIHTKYTYLKENKSHICQSKKVLRE